MEFVLILYPLTIEVDLNFVSVAYIIFIIYLSFQVSLSIEKS